MYCVSPAVPSPAAATVVTAPGMANWLCTSPRGCQLPSECRIVCQRCPSAVANMYCVSPAVPSPAAATTLTAPGMVILPCTASRPVHLPSARRSVCQRCPSAVANMYCVSPAVPSLEAATTLTAPGMGSLPCTSSRRSQLPSACRIVCQRCPSAVANMYSVSLAVPLPVSATTLTALGMVILPCTSSRPVQLPSARRSVCQGCPSFVVAFVTCEGICCA